MTRTQRNRIAHYTFLIVTLLLLTLPLLGLSSLWDIDEGDNAEVAREMLVSGNWVMPTYGNQLYPDKPILLYWLQATAYKLFGINEFGARLPPPLAATATVLATYELAACMFSPGAGLMAGLVLAGAPMFFSSAHFDNADSLLAAFMTLTYLFFWRGFSVAGYNWFVPAGISVAFAVLAKGPIGLLLPGLSIGMFLIATGRLSLLYDRRLLAGIAVFAVIALPWHIAIMMQAHGQFMHGFLLVNNVLRFLHPMQNHDEPAYYYLIVLLLGFAPWTAVMGAATGYSWLSAKAGKTATREAAAHLLLWCWIIMYLLFFTLAQTKCPNYVRPVMPALAVAAGAFLDRWRSGGITGFAHTFKWSFALMLCIGIAFTAGAVVITNSRLNFWVLGGYHYPGLELLVALGVLFSCGVAAAWWQCYRQQRERCLAVLAATAFLFNGGLVAFGGAVIEQYKAPKALSALVEKPEGATVRVAVYQYFQSSLTFYLRSNVQRLTGEHKAHVFLSEPQKSYVFMPRQTWLRLKRGLPDSVRPLALRYDIVDRYHDVVLVTNNLDPQSSLDPLIFHERPKLASPSPLADMLGSAVSLALGGFYASGP